MVHKKAKIIRDITRLDTIRHEQDKHMSLLHSMEILEEPEQTLLVSLIKAVDIYMLKVREDLQFIISDDGTGIGWDSRYENMVFNEVK